MGAFPSPHKKADTITIGYLKQKVKKYAFRNRQSSPAHTNP